MCNQGIKTESLNSRC